MIAVAEGRPLDPDTVARLRARGLHVTVVDTGGAGWAAVITRGPIGDGEAYGAWRRWRDQQR